MQPVYRQISPDIPAGLSHTPPVNFLETIEAAIDRYGLIPPETEVVVGLSGGADSVALLRAMHQLGIPCTAAHMNHRLRGADADADEHFVCGLAEELDLPIVVKHADVRTMAEETGVSIEMAARQARHHFFAEFDESVIALAHHADDQAETFILKMARGAGADGLGGMSYSQQIGPVRLIRPMLDISRGTILQWLKEHHFTWREDTSNFDDSFLRNRVRQTILPMLEKELNPNIRETILRTMDILREENEWMDGLVGDCRLPAADLPLAARRRILRKWLFENGAEGVGFGTVETILELMDAGKGTTVFELNDSQRIVVEYGEPRFEDVAHPGSSGPPAPTWETIIEPGNGWRRDHGQGAGILPAEASFNADKVGDTPIEVRTWQPGDRIEPLGLAGSRKLQDIFTDQKIPLAQRSRIPVVTCRDEIIWLPGYRTARGWEVAGMDGPAVHMRVEPGCAASYK